MVWEANGEGTPEVGTPDGPVKVSTSVFVDAVKEAARVRGYKGQIKVFVDGDEVVDPADAPVTFTSDMDVRIEPYNKAG